MLETAERFTPVEKEPAIRQFLLLIGGLRALGDAVDPGDPAAGGDPAPMVTTPRQRPPRRASLAPTALLAPMTPLAARPRGRGRG